VTGAFRTPGRLTRAGTDESRESRPLGQSATRRERAHVPAPRGWHTRSRAGSRFGGRRRATGENNIGQGGTGGKGGWAGGSVGRWVGRLAACQAAKASAHSGRERRLACLGRLAKFLRPRQGPRPSLRSIERSGFYFPRGGVRRWFRRGFPCRAAGRRFGPPRRAGIFERMLTGWPRSDARRCSHLSRQNLSRLPDRPPFSGLRRDHPAGPSTIGAHSTSTGPPGGEDY